MSDQEEGSIESGAYIDDFHHWIVREQRAAQANNCITVFGAGSNGCFVSALKPVSNTKPLVLTDSPWHDLDMEEL